MNILLLSGSPRAEGNTSALLHEIAAGAEESGSHSVKIVDVAPLCIAPCQGCGHCRATHVCVQSDDMTLLLDELRQADWIIFGSPVYWWGITAQLKTVIDRLYADPYVLKNKSVGLVLTGGAATDAPQYQLIQQQFECMAKAIGFNLAYVKDVSATKAGEVRDNADLMKELHDFGKSL